jgi:hypothetical protein
LLVPLPPPHGEHTPRPQTPRLRLQSAIDLASAITAWWPELLDFLWLAVGASAGQTMTVVRWMDEDGEVENTSRT